MDSRAAWSAFHLIDSFVPPALQSAEPERLRRARLVATACLVSAGSHGAASILLAALGLPLVAAGNFGSALLSLLLAWMFRRGASMELVTNGLLGVLLLFAAGIAGASGGDANSALHTVTIIPGIAILLLGWRSGAAWAVVVCAFAAGLGMLRASGFDFPVQLDPERVALGKYPGVIALTLGISAVILLSEWARRQALGDLAEARRAAERTERTRRELENAMLESQRLESLGVMAGGVAHDFNNLLTTILGNASLLPGESDAETGVLADEIVLGAEQARDLTDQLLAFAGRSRSVRGAVALSDVVREVDALAYAAKDPDVELRFELAAGPTTVAADPGQMRQVVLNLVTNASAAIAGRGTVVVRTGTQDAETFVEVEDDGIGMSEEVRARIFDPFFTMKQTGRGLGLSAVLGIVRSHGGRIQVDSALDRGTRMRVLLPRVDQQPAEPGAIAAAGAVPQLSGKALVVDDVEAVRRLARRALGDMGLEVLEARDGQEALEIVDAHPDLGLVLLDATMPGLRGDEVWAEIVKRRPFLPVILSTGYAQGFASLDPKTPGTYWLPKPYRAAALQDVAARAVAGAGAGEAHLDEPAA